MTICLHFKRNESVNSPQSELNLSPRIARAGLPPGLIQREKLWRLELEAERPAKARREVPPAGPSLTGKQADE